MLSSFYALLVEMIAPTIIFINTGSVWVVCGARLFQHGGFSTFAQPSETGLSSS